MARRKARAAVETAKNVAVKKAEEVKEIVETVAEAVEEKAEEITRKFRPTVNVWMIVGIIIILDLAYCAHNWVLNSLDLRRRKRRSK